MIKLRLKRLALLPECALGVLLVDGLPMFTTIERPWLNNKPNESCVPAGTYPVKWVKTQTSGNLDGHGIGIEDVPGRSLIRIHKANIATDVKGCIGVGMQFHEFGTHKGVGHSGDALHDLMKMMKEQEGTLHIENPS